MVGGTEQDGEDSDVVVDFDDNSYAVSDNWGLKETYNLNESVLHHADTLYIAGTHTWRDVADDTLIPLHLVRNSQRYQQALAALRQANGRIKYLAGHSLGGAVAAVLQEDAVAGNLGPQYRGFREVRTYGAPLLHSNQIPNLHAYRHPWDPISAFDGGAATSPAPGWNAHSYRGFNRSNSVPPITRHRHSNVYVM